MRSRHIALAAIAATLALPIASASAQTNTVPNNVISIQPLNAIFTVYSGEYERRASQAVTFGFGGTHFSVGEEGVDDVTYTSGDIKLRYYPNGQALVGFSFGASLGYSSVSGRDYVAGVDQKASGMSAGVLLEYQWLMGTRRNVSVALGAGAKMLMVDENDVSNATARYPTARVSVGYAF